MYNEHTYNEKFQSFTLSAGMANASPPTPKWRGCVMIIAISLYQLWDPRALLNSLPISHLVQSHSDTNITLVSKLHWSRLIQLIEIFRHKTKIHCTEISHWWRCRGDRRTNKKTAEPRIFILHFIQFERLLYTFHSRWHWAINCVSFGKKLLQANLS